MKQQTDPGEEKLKASFVNTAEQHSVALDCPQQAAAMVWSKGCTVPVVPGVPYGPVAAEFVAL